MDTVSKYANDAASGVDRAATKVHNGIRDAQETADEVVVDAKGRVKQGIQGVRNAVQHTRDTVAASSDSVIAYTRENPVKALAIAAVSGAVIWTIARALASSRE